MAVNKVEYGDTTLIDLTSDTVTKETLLIGATAHTASGESISGEFDPEIYLRKSGGDTTNNIVTFTSGDSPSPTAWTNVDSLVTGEKHSSLLNKISTMIKNVRFLYKVLGTTDISTIGDGTVTGAVSTLNSSLEELGNNVILVNAEFNITDKTYTLPQPLSNFKYIAIAQNGVGDVSCFDIKMLPVSIFKLYDSTHGVRIDVGEVVSYVCYISDNSIKISMPTEYAHAVVYGIK